MSQALTSRKTMQLFIEQEWIKILLNPMREYGLLIIALNIPLI